MSAGSTGSVEHRARLNQRISENEWDVEAWTALAVEAQKMDNESEARDIFQRFLAAFPSAGRYWKMYVDFELRCQNFDAVEKIFQKCLNPDPAEFSCPHLDLWRAYLNYLRVKLSSSPATSDDSTAQPATTTSGGALNAAGFEQLLQAYDFVLGALGEDINSTMLWSDYIALLKQLPETNMSAKIDAIRKAYHRAVSVPVHAVESLWKQYDAWENSMDKIIAKRETSLNSSRYLAARTAYRERKQYYDGLALNGLAVPPGVDGAGGLQQVHLWKRLIAYEKRQQIDQQLLWKRVLFTYNQAVLALWHHADLWFEFALWLGSNLDAAAAADAVDACYRRAFAALPDSLLLRFAYADWLESQGKDRQCLEVFEKYIADKKDAAAPLVWVQYLRSTRRLRGPEEARKVFVQHCQRHAKPSYQVFVASATLEFHKKNTNVARDIFELGMKRYFSSEPLFCLEYLRFLGCLHEENNMRHLFERVLGSLPPDKSAEVWSRFLDFEYTVGDLNSIAKLEQRKQSAFPHHDTDVLLAVARYRYLDLAPCTPAELTAFAVPADVDAASSASSSLAVASLSAAASSSAADKEDERQMKLRRQRGAALDPLRFARESRPASLAAVPLPDMAQMEPFRPELSLMNGYTLLARPKPAVAIGQAPVVTALDPGRDVISTPLPPNLVPMSKNLLNFITSLPPAAYWRGPKIDADIVIDMILQLNFENGPPGQAMSDLPTTTLTAPPYAPPSSGQWPPAPHYLPDADPRAKQPGYGYSAQPPAPDSDSLYRRRMEAQSKKQRT